MQLFIVYISSLVHQKTFNKEKFSLLQNECYSYSLGKKQITGVNNNFTSILTGIKKTCITHKVDIYSKTVETTKTTMIH